MSKVRNFAELAPNIGFSEFDFYDLYRSTFEKSELGRMKKLLPLHAMTEDFGLVRKELARVRATAMEGSFGTQKEHYDLRRVKARTKLTEILYIFFENCAHKSFPQGNYASVIEHRQIIRTKRP